MLEPIKHTLPKRSSERNFGIVFTVVFSVAGTWPLLNSNTPHWAFLLIASFILIITFVRPTWLTKPNYYWFKFGLLLGAVIAPVVMALVFLITIVPIGLIAKFMNKDILDERIDRSATSYWKHRTEPMQPFNKQY